MPGNLEERAFGGGRGVPGAQGNAESGGVEGKPDHYFPLITIFTLIIA